MTTQSSQDERDERKAWEVFEQARKNEGPSAQRKHHLVPASYLRRWQQGGQIRVTELGIKSYKTSPEKAARETDFYRLEHPEVDPEHLPPLLFETLLGKLEGSAKLAIDVLLEQQPGALDDEIMQEFAWHLSFQFVRGYTFREENRNQLASMYRLQYANVSDEQIRKRLEKKGIPVTPEEVLRNREFLDKVKSGEFRFHQNDYTLIGRAAETAAELVRYFLARWWYVFDTPSILVTCDEPVIPLGGPGTQRDERGGLATAGVILHPLSPSRLLAMFHPALKPTGTLALDRLETIDINREILASATRWAFDQPDRKFTEKMPVPPPAPKTLLPEGPIPWADQERGDLYKYSKRTRWASSPDPPPWPVDRWWYRPPGTAQGIFALPPIALPDADQV